MIAKTSLVIAALLAGPAAARADNSAPPAPGAGFSGWQRDCAARFESARKSLLTMDAMRAARVAQVTPSVLGRGVEVDLTIRFGPSGASPFFGAMVLIDPTPPGARPTEPWRYVNARPELQWWMRQDGRYSAEIRAENVTRAEGERFRRAFAPAIDACIAAAQLAR